MENKRVCEDLDKISKSEQIQKYLKLNSNIMLTDYLTFCLVREQDSKPIITQKVTICDFNELKKHKSSEILKNKEKELKELFSLFYSQDPQPINTAQEFASSLAQRTRILKDELLKNKENLAISGVYNAFKECLSQELSFDEFGDSFAQTLTYCLFLARLNSDSKIDLYNVKKFIPKSFSLLREISGFLDRLENLYSCEWLLKEIICIVNNINVESLIKELNKNSSDIIKDPYLHFYENFLAQYDEALRKGRGVYYTPAPVVDFIINALDDVLKKDFGYPRGLGAALEHDITLLDFACGTGTFLLEAFKKALESIPSNSPHYEPKKLIPKFMGFEYLIAPYAIAHLRISHAFSEDFHAPLSESESLTIKSTNTLYFNPQAQEEWDRAFEKSPYLELTHEARDSQRIKEGEILIITGNPPYSGASANKGMFEDEVRKAYKEPMEKHGSPTLLLKNGKALKEKNPKMLLDDYVKFIRFAEKKIESQNAGIFAFISNNSFIDNPTFRAMRHHLLKSFDSIYILDLHGNARKKEISPDGSKDENVFDIMQGVSINIFVKNPKNPHDSATLESESLAKVYHYDLYGKREDKYKFLYKNTLDSIAWNNLSPKTQFFLFIPQDEGLRVEYDNGWSVKDMFERFSVGIETQRDKICFQNSKEALEELLHDFITKPEEELRRIYNIGEDGESWKLEWAIESIKEHKEDLDSFIMPCHYRPFDSRWTFYIDESSGFMARPRYEVLQNLLPNGTDSSKLVENFTPEFRSFVDSKYKEHFSAEQILGYIYAILFHKDYREKYIDFLKMDFPKIPFVESKDKFSELSNLGLKLIDIHLMSESSATPPHTRVRNIALNVARQYKVSGTWQCAIVTDTISDRCLMGGGNTGGGTMFPLYIKT